MGLSDAVVGLLGVLVGALLALAGVGLSELGAWRRAKTDQRVAEDVRKEERRKELWSISLPAAARIQKTLAEADRRTFPLLDLVEPDAKFDLSEFVSWWESQRATLRLDIALIPSRDFRQALGLAVRGIGHASTRFKGGVLPSDDHNLIHDAAGVGFDLASRWMRDELEIDARLVTRLSAIESALIEHSQRMLLEMQRHLDELQLTDDGSDSTASGSSEAS